MGAEGGPTRDQRPRKEQRAGLPFHPGMLFTALPALASPAPPPSPATTSASGPSGEGSTASGSSPWPSWTPEANPSTFSMKALWPVQPRDKRPQATPGQHANLALGAIHKPPEQLCALALCHGAGLGMETPQSDMAPAQASLCERQAQSQAAGGKTSRQNRFQTQGSYGSMGYAACSSPRKSRRSNQDAFFGSSPPLCPASAHISEDAELTAFPRRFHPWCGLAVA